MSDDTPAANRPSIPAAENIPSPSTSPSVWGKLGVYALAALMVVVLAQVIPFRFLLSLHPLTHRHVADDCRECWGDGKTERPCRICLGRGYVHGANCAECDKTGKVEETCRYCGGSGKKPKN